MASLSSKVKTYLANNGVNEVDFMVDVLLQDDSNGQGPYIKSWNVSGVPQPTSEQLDAVDSAADLEERQNAVRATRRNAYGNIGDQLDMQYHDSVDGTSTWKDHVAKVKTDNPIPTE
tara:strand:+ start:131 stop:481 length:351 start_codon:yes stop_codon:yes gene_type:complete